MDRSIARSRKGGRSASWGNHLDRLIDRVIPFPLQTSPI